MVTVVYGKGRNLHLYVVLQSCLEEDGTVRDSVGRQKCLGFPRDLTEFTKFYSGLSVHLLFVLFLYVDIFIGTLLSAGTRSTFAIVYRCRQIKRLGTPTWRDEGKVEKRTLCQNRPSPREP